MTSACEMNRDTNAEEDGSNFHIVERIKFGGVWESKQIMIVKKAYDKDGNQATGVLEESGVLPGDIMLRVNGADIYGMKHYIAASNVGKSTFNVTIVRPAECDIQTKKDVVAERVMHMVRVSADIL